jgi:hypothetical protein
MSVGTIEIESLFGRYYDPSTDQFLSVDPDVGATGQPYAFTGDDPVNLGDPKGLYVSGSSTERVNPVPSQGMIYTTGATPTGVSVAGSDNLATGTTTGAFSSAVLPPPTLSTNDDWAVLVLEDGGWQTSANNIQTLLDWMASEQSNLSIWWTGGSNDRGHINPLNNGLCTGYGSGLGTNTNLLQAASCAVSTLEDSNSEYGYSNVIEDFEASTNPSVTGPDIWNSSWSGGHYGYGAAWHTGPVASVPAPVDLW